MHSLIPPPQRCLNHPARARYGPPLQPTTYEPLLRSVPNHDNNHPSSLPSSPYPHASSIADRPLQDHLPFPQLYLFFLSFLSLIWLFIFGPLTHSLIQSSGLRHCVDTSSLRQVKQAKGQYFFPNKMGKHAPQPMSLGKETFQSRGKHSLPPSLLS
jgi:hypothetical protein